MGKYYKIIDNDIYSNTLKYFYVLRFMKIQAS